MRDGILLARNTVELLLTDPSKKVVFIHGVQEGEFFQLDDPYFLLQEIPADHRGPRVFQVKGEAKVDDVDFVFPEEGS